MEILFADTSFFVAYHSLKDEHHQTARTLVQGFEGQLVLTVTAVTKGCRKVVEVAFRCVWR